MAKKIFKGALLWITALVIFMYMSCIGSLIDNIGIFLLSTGLIICLIKVCKEHISYDELLELSSYNIFSRLLCKR